MQARGALIVTPCGPAAGVGFTDTHGAEDDAHAAPTPSLFVFQPSEESRFILGGCGIVPGVRKRAEVMGAGAAYSRSTACTGL